jgi:hypothetical protein
MWGQCFIRTLVISDSRLYCMSSSIIYVLTRAPGSATPLKKVGFCSVANSPMIWIEETWWERNLVTNQDSRFLSVVDRLNPRVTQPGNKSRKFLHLVWSPSDLEQLLASEHGNITKLRWNGMFRVFHLVFTERKSRVEIILDATNEHRFISSKDSKSSQIP